MKILTIGNSFSDDTMKYVYNIASESGVEDIKLGNLYIPGCTLDTHYNNSVGDLPAYNYRKNYTGEWEYNPDYKLSTALASEKWDIISMQQQSGTSGKPETYSHLCDLITYVKGFCPDATLVWNMTWAFEQTSTHSQFPLYNSDQMTMYTAITNTVKQLIVPNDNFSRISPTGTAIQNARTSYLGDTLTRDGFHLKKDIGRFTAGLTFVNAITGKNIDGVKFRPEGVDEKAAQVAIKSANRAVKNPFEITKFN